MDSNRAREASAEVCVNGDMPSWWIVIRRIGVIEAIRAGIGAAPAQAVRERTPLVEGIGDGVGACGAGEGSQMGPGSCATAPRPVAPLPAQPPRSSNVPPRKSLRVGGVARCVEWLIMAWGVSKQAASSPLTTSARQHCPLEYTIETCQDRRSIFRGVVRCSTAELIDQAQCDGSDLAAANDGVIDAINTNDFTGCTR